MQGSFFWYDVMSTDVPATAKFYGAVVGWGTQDVSHDTTSYHLLTLSGRGVAGMMPIPADMLKSGGKPAWLGYIEVDDVDRMAGRIEQEGGKLHRGPITVPGTIRFAVVSDPLGAGFLIAKPLSGDAPPALPPAFPGTFGWHELYSTDWKAAFGFYEKLFGWSKDQAVDMGPMGTYQLFRTGGANAVGGMMNSPPAMPSSFWAYYINVAAIDAAVARVTASGGRLLNGPHQVPGGSWIAQATDPLGAYFCLVAPQR